MRSIFVAFYLLLAVALVPELVHSAPCPDICNSKRVWGFGGQSTGFAPCECTDPVVTAFRTGPNGCECNVCYTKEGTGRVTAYAPLAPGQCRAGQTFCDDCDLSIIDDTDSGSKDTNTTTTAPPTSTPPGSTAPSTTPLTPSSPSDASSSIAGNTGAPVSSNSSQSGAGDDAGTGSTDDSTMATWQIALIICSCVLVFAVVVMTIMSCYCKTRKQMKDNDNLEQETREYENYWHPGNSTTAEARAVGGQMGKSLNSSVISAQHTLGGRSSFTSSHSRPNSTKNVQYVEQTFAENDKMGRPAARQSLGSRSDLPPVFNAFPQRPAHELNNRNNVAIEL